MIIFERIRWMNFLSTGSTFTEVVLNNHHTTLIIGENGVGKSTILDAISFCLYNKSFRNINKPQLINSIVGKGLLVEVEFRINTKSYKVRRGMKPNIFEIFINDELINQSADNRDYQALLEKTILKLNHKSFSQIVVLGSANFTPFMQLPAAARREVIEDLLDLQIFSLMNTILKDKIVTNKDNIVDISNDLVQLKYKSELHEKHVKNTQSNYELMIARKKEMILQYQSQMMSINNSIEAVRKKIWGLSEKTTQTDQIDEKINTITKLQYNLQQKRSNIDKSLEFFQNNQSCPTCRQDIHDDFKQATISKKLTTKQEIDNALHKIVENLKKVKAMADLISSINKKIAAHNQELVELNSQIRSNQMFIDQSNDEISQIEKQMREDIKDDNFAAELKEKLKETGLNKKRLLEQKELLLIASALLKDGGIKTKIVRQYVPVMNKLINKYLAAMDFYVNFELNEDFSESIKSRYRDEFSYQSFSQGEKFRIDLALLFTWRAVAKLRNSAATNLLIMDEVMDGSLDSNGTDEFLKILKSLTIDTNVFVISHKTHLQDKFDHVLEFKKIKNFSRIVSS